MDAATPMKPKNDDEEGHVSKLGVLMFAGRGDLAKLEAESWEVWRSAVE